MVFLTLACAHARYNMISSWQSPTPRAICATGDAASTSCLPFARPVSVSKKCQQCRWRRASRCAQLAREPGCRDDPSAEHWRTELQQIIRPRWPERQQVWHTTI